MDYEFSITNYELRITNFQLRITDYGLRIFNYKMNKKQKIIPALRFSEFEEEGEWEVKELGGFLLKSPEYGINAAAVPYSENLPTYLRITDISTSGKFLTNKKVSVAKNVTEDNYLEKGDIVLARTGASVGKSYKYRDIDGKLVFAGFLIRIKPDTNKLNSELLFQFLSTEHYWKWVKFTSARSGQPGINGKEYASMPVFIPPTLKEQKKIASCLSSLDAVIESITEKLKLLKNHKKGLLQQLFPAEGETKPKVRFEEFVNDGEWGKKELGECLDYLQPTKYLVKSTDYDKTYPTPVLTAGKTFILGYTDEKEGIFDTNLPVIIFDDFTTASKFVDFPFKAKSSAMKLLLSKNETNIRFIYGVIQNIKFEVSTHKRHWISVYSKLKILVPSLKEQQKIADCLSSLDDLIEFQSEKIKSLKEHKKGLMQQLFPSTTA